MRSLLLAAAFAAVAGCTAPSSAPPSGPDGQLLLVLVGGSMTVWGDREGSLAGPDYVWTDCYGVEYNEGTRPPTLGFTLPEGAPPPRAAIVRSINHWTYYPTNSSGMTHGDKWESPWLWPFDPDEAHVQVGSPFDEGRAQPALGSHGGELDVDGEPLKPGDGVYRVYDYAVRQGDRHYRVSESLLFILKGSIEPHVTRGDGPCR